MKRKILIWLFILILLKVASAMALQGSAFLSSKDQDAKYRETVVGKEQLEVEKSMIAAQNGVFVLFTPTHGTPQMISETGEIPDGLIPKSRMASYETTVKPRVETVHAMPKNNIRCVYIRHSPHRSQAESESEYVDESHYKHFIAKYPNRILDKTISPEIYQLYANKGMPAAFYYYKVDQKIHFSAVFAKQINSKMGNLISDPGVYTQREQDLKVVNEMLIGIGLQSVEKLAQMELDQAELGTIRQNNQRRSARIAAKALPK